MICLNCRRNLLQRSASVWRGTGGSQWTTSRTYAKASPNLTISKEAIPQTPETPSKDALAKSTKMVSAMKVGQTIKGINYLKNRPDPVALEDSEYPDWLWTCLESHKPRLTMEAQLSSEDAANLYSKSKSKRRAAAKKIAARGDQDVVIDVPLDHQTVDIPYDDAISAGEVRMATKKVQRARNRAGIKERNYLGGLR